MKLTTLNEIRIIVVILIVWETFQPHELNETLIQKPSEETAQFIEAQLQQREP
jgi:hypothetical protein